MANQKNRKKPEDFKTEEKKLLKHMRKFNASQNNLMLIYRRQGDHLMLMLMSIGCDTLRHVINIAPDWIDTVNGQFNSAHLVNDDLKKLKKLRKRLKRMNRLLHVEYIKAKADNGWFNSRIEGLNTNHQQL